MKVCTGVDQVKSLVVYFLQEVLIGAPTISLMIFSCKVKIFPLLEEFPQKIIPYFIIE
jgi:hypothetical protein